jgi:putative SOS response-associated peptidase YedK
MCGRFTLRTPATVLIEQFDLDVSADRQLELFKPRYNIAPTQDIIVVRANPDDRRRSAAMMRWGLIPSWTKEPKSGPPMINARAESLAEKPMFRTALRQRRCLIPADGFYEWRRTWKKATILHSSAG